VSILDRLPVLRESSPDVMRGSGETQQYQARMIVHPLDKGAQGAQLKAVAGRDGRG